MNNILKIFAILSLPLLLNACGGGGGGGSAGGGAGYTVPSCTDAGNSTIRDAEYYGMSNGSNYALARICAGAAYARGATGSGIKVAVIDTGIALYGSGNNYHLDFGGNNDSLPSSKIVTPTGSDNINSDNIPNDDEGHGTHVAGIIGADNDNQADSPIVTDGMHGVAYESQLYIFKAGNSDGAFPDAAIASSLSDAITAGVDIINNSYGDSGEIGVDCNSASSCETAIGSSVYTQMEGVGAADIINVWAAGNDSKDNPSLLAGAHLYDTDFQDLSIAVVAVGTDGKIASYSNKCGVVAAYCVAAPGSSIYAPWYFANGYHVAQSGTSMAAPMVSGALALVKHEFSSLTNAQVVSRLFTTALDTDEYSQSSIYGHGLINLNAATAAVGSLQTIGGSNLLDDPNASYYDLINNNFISSAAFSNALTNALDDQTMEVYDSFDRANFKTNVSGFFTYGSYTSQNTIENHMARLQPKTMEKVKNKTLYGSFTVETDGNFIGSSMFQTADDFLALGFNQSTNSFENAVDPLSNFFNDSNFGNNYLVNPYFNTGSGQDYFISFNTNSSFGFDSFTNADGNDLGLAFNLNPLSSSDEGIKNAGDLQIVFGANYEQNKFLNSTSTGVFATGDLSNTNFTGVKYKKNLGDDFTFVGSGFAGYTYIDKAADSYIDSSKPLLTSSFTLGLTKANFLKEDQRIGFFVNQPQRVEDGTLNLRVPTSSDRDRNVTYSNLNVDLEPDARQINFDIIFNKIITESSNLSANLTHVRNGDHSNESKNQNFFSLFYKKTF
jgi:subtilisin family serine protease